MNYGIVSISSFVLFICQLMRQMEMLVNYVFSFTLFDENRRLEDEMARYPSKSPNIEPVQILELAFVE